MNKSAHIFDKTSCPSTETLKKHYLKELNKNEMRELELHLVDCELCNDVLDGLGEMKHPNKLDLYTSEIEQNLKRKTTGRNIGMSLKIAAAIAFLILAGGSIFLFDFLKEEPSESMLGSNIQKEEKSGKGGAAIKEKKEESFAIEEKEEVAPTRPEESDEGSKSSEKDIVAGQEVAETVSEPEKKEIIEVTEVIVSEEVAESTHIEEVTEPDISEANESEYALYEIEKKEEPLANKTYPPAMTSAKTRASYQPKGSGGKDAFAEIEGDSIVLGKKSGGKINYSIEELEYLLKSDSENGDLLLALAEVYYKAGDYKKSLKTISRIIDLKQAKNYTECKILLEKITEESPKHTNKIKKLLREME